MITDWRAARDRLRALPTDPKACLDKAWLAILLDAIALADELDRRDTARRLCPHSKTAFTWDDIADDIKGRVELSEEAAQLMGEPIRILLGPEMQATPDEIAALQAARFAARCIADRQAAVALRALRVRVGGSLKEGS